MKNINLESFINKVKQKQSDKISCIGRTFYLTHKDKFVLILQSLDDMLKKCSDPIKDFPGFEISMEDFKEWTKLNKQSFSDSDIKLAFDNLNDIDPSSSVDKPYAYTIFYNPSSNVLRFHNPLILEKVVGEIKKQFSDEEKKNKSRLDERKLKDKQNKKEEMKALKEKGKADIPNRIIATVIGGLLVAAIIPICKFLPEIVNYIRSIF